MNRTTFQSLAGAAPLDARMALFQRQAILVAPFIAAATTALQDNALHNAGMETS